MPEYLRVAVFPDNPRNQLFVTLMKGFRSVRRPHQLLCEEITFFLRPLVHPSCRRIEKQQCILSVTGCIFLINQCTARIHRAVLIRCDCHILLFPVHKIRTGGMSPGHILPFCRIRIVLMEHMINAIRIHQSVRIVHPAVCRRIMQPRAVRIIILRTRLLLTDTNAIQILLPFFADNPKLFSKILRRLPCPVKINMLFSEGNLHLLNLLIPVIYRHPDHFSGHIYRKPEILLTHCNLHKRSSRYFLHKLKLYGSFAGSASL